MVKFSLKKKDLREFSIQIFIENYLFEKYFDIYYVWFYVYNLSTRYFLKYFVKNLKEVEKASQTEKFHQILETCKIEPKTRKETRQHSERCRNALSLSGNATILFWRVRTHMLVVKNDVYSFFLLFLNRCVWHFDELSFRKCMLSTIY